MYNIVESVKEKWRQLTAFSKKEEIKELLWDEILYRYSEQHRHYHNLGHLAWLFRLCDENMESIKNPALVGFAIFYHDIVYDTYRHDNEEQSAAIAGGHLRELNINPALIDNVQLFIKASKTHNVPENFQLHNDLALFLDFDMSILAAAPGVYKRYSDSIRLEYAKYPEPLYREGRRQALKKMLDTQNIFATQKFRNEMEEKARQNLAQEINTL